MGTTLTDILVELSSPLRRLEFKKDPSVFLSVFLAHRSLPEAEFDALLSGKLTLLWRHARSVDSEDPSQQFNRFDNRISDLLIEIDPVVEQHQEHNDLTAAYPPGTKQTIIDEQGRLYAVMDQE